MQAPEKARPGRKPLADGEGKTARVSLKMRPAEKAEWLALATASKLKLQVWIRERCNGKS